MVLPARVFGAATAGHRTWRHCRRPACFDVHDWDPVENGARGRRFPSYAIDDNEGVNSPHLHR